MHDPVRFALATITMLHAHTHEGIVYVASNRFAGVLNNGFARFLIQTPANPPHMRISMNAGGDAVGTVYEDTTFSAAGTSVPAINKNRLSSNVALTTITHTPTITDNGTELLEDFISGGNFFILSGPAGGSGDFEEFVMKPSSNYLVALQNVSGGTTDLGLILTWYEDPT